jgi:hypothetical protein
MKHLRFIPLLGLFFYACADADAPKTNIAPLQSKAVTKAVKECLRDSLCYSISLDYPVLSGGPNPAATASINDSLLSGVYSILEVDPKLPMEAAFDSARLRLRGLLALDMEMMPDVTDREYYSEVDGRMLWQNGTYVSVEMNASGFTGGAHGFYGTALTTYDLQTGKSLLLSQVFTNPEALRPLLEKAFVEAKKEMVPDVTLEELLLEPEKGLALPENFCLLPEGVRFMYNPYEVAPYAVGQTDLLLSWDQLGALAKLKI